MKPIIFLVLYFGLSCCVAAQSLSAYAQRLAKASQLGPEPNLIEQFLAVFVGHFSNKKQADTTSLAQLNEQEIIIQRIWEQRFPDEYWLSVAWFPANYYKRPLAQGIFKLEMLSEDTISMMVYNLPDLDKYDYYEKEWFKDKPFEKKLSPKNLTYAKKCPNLVYLVEGNKWRWHSPFQECFIEAGDFVRYIYFDIYLYGNFFKSLCTFYSKQKQVLVKEDEMIYTLMERLAIEESVKKIQAKLD